MAVYVDAAIHNYGRMVMCHMLADNIDDLHEMADKIGIQRKWFQGKASSPHYDICKAKRTEAINNGAIEVSRKELVQVIKRLRKHNENLNAS